METSIRVNVQVVFSSLMVEKAISERGGAALNAAEHLPRGQKGGLLNNCSSEIGQNIDTAVCICSVQQGSLWYVAVPLKSGVPRQQPDQLYK